MRNSFAENEFLIQIVNCMTESEKYYIAIFVTFVVNFTMTFFLAHDIKRKSVSLLCGKVNTMINENLSLY